MGGRAGRKFIRENQPVLFVLAVRDGEIILENGEILSEKRQTWERLKVVALMFFI